MIFVKRRILCHFLIQLKRLSTERPNEHHTSLRLGGPSSDVTDGYVRECFDDVALYIPEADEELPSLNSLTGQESKIF